jgi:hypothetical protein
MQEFERAAENVRVGQGEAGGLMNVLVIIDNQYMPSVAGVLSGFMAGLGVEVKQIVVGIIGHESALANREESAGYRSTVMPVLLIRLMMSGFNQPVAVLTMLLKPFCSLVKKSR